MFIKNADRQSHLSRQQFQQLLHIQEIITIKKVQMKMLHILLYLHQPDQ